MVDRRTGNTHQQPSLAQQYTTYVRSDRKKIGTDDSAQGNRQMELVRDRQQVSARAVPLIALLCPLLHLYCTFLLSLSISPKQLETSCDVKPKCAFWLYVAERLAYFIAMGSLVPLSRLPLAAGTFCHDTTKVSPLWKLPAGSCSVTALPSTLMLCTGIAMVSITTS